jgi:hypothetical protein
MAVVCHGSPGGDLYERVFEYSHKDPRKKGEAAVLRDISQEIPARFRPFIVTISVIKRCLHPHSPQVAKRERTPYYERVFSWVVEHDNSRWQSWSDARRQYIESALGGHRVQSVRLPYTQHELRELPVTDVITTNYWPNAHASVGMRGVERRVELNQLVIQ